MKLYAAIAIFGIALVLVPQDCSSEGDNAQDDNGRFKRKAKAAAASKTKKGGQSGGYEGGGCPDNCSMEYAPVCGTNGKTYNNACALKVDACVTKANGTLTKQHDGNCNENTTEDPPATRKGGAKDKKGNTKKKGKRHALSHVHRGLRKGNRQNQRY